MVSSKKYFQLDATSNKEGGEAEKSGRKEVKRKGKDGIRKLVLFGVGRIKYVQSFPSL
jgi:hypothetical protein